MNITSQYIIFTSLLIFSCTSPSEGSSQVILFETTLLQGKEILTDEYGIISVNFFGGFLIAALNDNPLSYAIYDTRDSLKKLGTIGRIGNGPDEWKGFYATGQHKKTGLGHSFWVVDPIGYKLRLVNIEQSLHKGVPVVEEEYSLHPKYGLNQYTFRMDSGVFIGNLGLGAIDRTRLKKLDIATELSSHSELIPTVNGIERADPSDFYEIYFDYLGMKPDKTKFASAMFLFDRLDIFNADLTLVNSFVEKPEANYSLKDFNFDNKTFHYRSVKVTDNFIYAAYRKQKFTEFIDEADSKISTSPKSEIRIFNWEGQLLEVLEVPYNVMSFAIDEKNHLLYIIDYYNEKNIKINISNISIYK
ncbi:hypothetical protein ACV07N_07060 [Roseivirga echinicomitans]